jgi:hypothetical protein
VVTELTDGLALRRRGPQSRADGSATAFPRGARRSATRMPTPLHGPRPVLGFVAIRMIHSGLEGLPPTVPGPSVLPLGVRSVRPAAPKHWGTNPSCLR